ncbi:MAG: hypothetical protein P8P99_00030 [Maricaulis sp.]|nr:hypothetical protein [Maricaulis sp.]
MMSAYDKLRVEFKRHHQRILEQQDRLQSKLEVTLGLEPLWLEVALQNYLVRSLQPILEGRVQFFEFRQAVERLDHQEVYAAMLDHCALKLTGAEASEIVININGLGISDVKILLADGKQVLWFDDGEAKVRLYGEKYQSISVDMARSIASSYLSDDVILDQDPIITGDTYWVFSFASANAAETGAFEDQLVGNAPIIIRRCDGEMLPSGTAHPIGHYVDILKQSRSI